VAVADNTKTKRLASPREKGFALMIVLWVVAIMGTFTLMYSSQTRLSLKVSRNAQDGAQARLLAEAGLHRFMAELMQDKNLTTSDNKNETWFSSSSYFYDVPMGNGIYRLTHPGLGEDAIQYYGGVDECGKLNVNTATREMLLQLPNATEEAVDSLLDWRDEDDEPEPFGAETPYYMSLAEPYRPKNGLIDTVDELLIIKSINLNLLYGEDTNMNGTLDVNENDGAESMPADNSDGALNMGWRPYITAYSYAPNTDSTGQARININSADEQALEENFGEILSRQEIQNIISEREDEAFESVAHVMEADIDESKWRQIVDRITVSEEQQLTGRVNLNTASQQVLQCLLPENPDIVQAIIEYRESGNGPFQDLGGLLEVQGMNEDVLYELASLVSTKSSVFSARSTGYLQRTGAFKQIHAIIDRGEDTPKIMYWKEVR